MLEFLVKHLEQAVALGKKNDWKACESMFFSLYEKTFKVFTNPAELLEAQKLVKEYMYKMIAWKPSLWKVCVREKYTCVNGIVTINGRQELCFNCHGTGVICTMTGEHHQGKRAVKKQEVAVVVKQAEPTPVKVQAEVLAINTWIYGDSWQIVSIAAITGSKVLAYEDKVVLDASIQDVVKKIIMDRFWPFQVDGIVVMDEDDNNSIRISNWLRERKGIPEASRLGIHVTHLSSSIGQLMENWLEEHGEFMTTLLDLEIEEYDNSLAPDPSDGAHFAWKSAQDIFPE